MRRWFCTVPFELCRLDRDPVSIVGPLRRDLFGAPEARGEGTPKSEYPSCFCVWSANVRGFFGRIGRVKLLTDVDTFGELRLEPALFLFLPFLVECSEL